MSTVAIITGSRADRASLMPIATAIGGYWIHIDVWPSKDLADSAISCGAAVGEATTRLQLVNPDLVIVDGDRFEILGAVIAAFLLKIPIAHLSGGDVTEGSQDNAMRHAITKLSHLHFASNLLSAQRLVEMGEEPWRVHSVGSPAIDALLATPLFNRQDTYKQLGITGPYNLVAYQPATLATNPLVEAEVLLGALRQMDRPCVFTSLNADAFGREINDLFNAFCIEGKGVMVEMPQQLYYSAMRHAHVMVGNSSSGLYEAPSLQVPFVNVGERQKGRLMPNSVISCCPEAHKIIAACEQAHKLDCSEVVNPYGDGKSASRIDAILGSILKNVSRARLLHKGEAWPLTEFGKSFTVNEIGAGTRTKILSGGWQDVFRARTLN